jgi:hypothetical protein
MVANATPACHEATGVTQGVWPKPVAKSATLMAHAPQRGCRRGYHWRSGIEDRIRGLQRRHRRGRCRDHGPDSMARWVGGGLSTYPLRVLAPATVPEPAVEVVPPCHGLIHCPTLAVPAVAQRVLLHTLGLKGGKADNHLSKVIQK